jgi:hypothetical protein
MPEARADNVLMQKVRDGDLAKMAVLFERHHRPLFRYFLRLTGNREFSEDLAQDVFFRMLKYRHSYQDGSPFTPGCTRWRATPTWTASEAQGRGAYYTTSGTSRGPSGQQPGPQRDPVAAGRTWVCCAARWPPCRKRSASCWS